MGFCGLVVLLAHTSCPLLSPLRARLRATCLTLDVRSPSPEAPIPNVVSDAPQGCLALWLEERSIDGDEGDIARAVQPPTSAFTAFAAGDAVTLAEHLAGLAACELRGGGDKSVCFACEDGNDDGVRCAGGRLVHGTCLVGLGFPPVPWDVGAALCEAHGGCLGLALSASRRVLGLQNLQPLTLGPVVAGARYVACAEAAPGNGLIFVPQALAPSTGNGPPYAAIPQRPTIVGLPWLDCSGDEFSDAWDTFHAMLVREGVKNLLYDHVPTEVADYATVLLRDGAVHPFEQAELFKSVLAGEQPPSALQGYCFGGVVAARVAALRVLSDRETHGVPLMTADVLADLVHVRSSLGHQLQQDFLVCCSRWNFISGMDLNDIIDSERQWKASTLPDHAVAAEARALIAAAVPPAAQKALLPGDPGVDLNAPWPAALQRGTLDVCLFSLFHFGTLQDALTLMQVALSASKGVNVRVVHNKGAIRDKYFREISGAGRVEDYLDELCALMSCELEVPPWNELFKILDARYEQRAKTLLSADLPALARRTAGILERGKACDLVVSANMDLVYVALLSWAFPDAGLLYFATDSVLPHDLGAETLQLRLLAEELFARRKSRGRLIVTCEKLQAQTFYQLGFWPHLSVAAMLGRRGSMRREDAASVEDRSALVYGRAALRMTPFRSVLEAFRNASAGLRLPAFLYADGAVSGATWARLAACVFLPWHFHAVSLVEIISLDVPLLVPQGSFAYALLKAFNAGFRQDSTIYYTNDDAVMRDGPDMPSPFWSVLPSQPSRRQFLFWHELSHMAMRPGLIPFATVAELLTSVSDLQVLEAARRVMREAHLREVGRSARVVAGVLASLLADTVRTA